MPHPRSRGAPSPGPASDCPAARHAPEPQSRAVRPGPVPEPAPDGARCRTHRRFGVPRAEGVPFVLGLFGVSCIGAGAVLAAASEIDPISTAFWRFAIAAPCCFALALFTGGAGDVSRGLDLLRCPFAWGAAVAFAMVIPLWYSAQLLSSVASANALHNLAPVFVILLGWLLFAARPELPVTLGIALGVAGVATMAMGAGARSDRALEGDALACLAALALAAYYLLIVRIETLVTAWGLMGFVSLVGATLLGLALALAGGVAAPSDVAGWIVLAGVAVLGQIGGQACLARAVRAIGAARASALTLAEPAIAALLAYLFLAQALPRSEAVGIALIAAGLLLCRPDSRITRS